MRAVVQRVSRAQVSVEGQVVGGIGSGLLIYLGVAPSDGADAARHLAERLASLRIFADSTGRMNLSLRDVGGSALVVSQFTLFADSRRGHRPAFTSAATPELARELCERFIRSLEQSGVAQVSQGRFGAKMEVEAVNLGPVTIVATSAESPWVADCG
ncbi:MAG TPA: D-aminoacyl-tRNA deacylase [Candidatus Dormibacteraeota bacterium]